MEVEDTRSVLDLMLDGETDQGVIRRALDRREAEIQRVLNAMAEGDYELVPDDFDD